VRSRRVAGELVPNICVILRAPALGGFNPFWLRAPGRRSPWILLRARRPEALCVCFLKKPVWDPHRTAC